MRGLREMMMKWFTLTRPYHCGKCKNRWMIESAPDQRR